MRRRRTQVPKSRLLHVSGTLSLLPTCYICAAWRRQTYIYILRAKDRRRAADVWLMVPWLRARVNGCFCSGGRLKDLHAAAATGREILNRIGGMRQIIKCSMGLGCVAAWRAHHQCQRDVYMNSGMCAAYMRGNMV